MYQWNDKLDTEFVIFNGWDQLPDNNNALSYMARIGYALGSNTTLAFLGYGGPEQTAGVGSSGNWREGGEVIVTQKITDKFSGDLQLDYGSEDKVVDTGNSDWVAAGMWLIYDFTDKIELVFRQDYLRDKDGARTDGVQGLPTFAPGAGPELYSSTLTLNLKPMNNFQFRPEVRWDHSDKPGTYNGIRDQFTIGAGVAYLF